MRGTASAVIQQPALITIAITITSAIAIPRQLTELRSSGIIANAILLVQFIGAHFDHIHEVRYDLGFLLYGYCLKVLHNSLKGNKHYFSIYLQFCFFFFYIIIIWIDHSHPLTGHASCPAVSAP